MKTPRIYYVKSNRLPIFRGVSLPWIGIIIKEQYKGDVGLIKHETIHFEQIRRMGVLMYIVRYIFQLIFIGYDSMPMELEARQHESTPYNYRKRKWTKH